METRSAACSCGQLRIEVRGEPRGVGVCHCLACQRRTGSAFAALASFTPPYQVTGEATEYVRQGDQGARFRFRFCPTCGTNLFHTEEGFEARSVSVALGAFDDQADLPPPQVSVYDSRRHPWVQLSPDAQVFDRDPG
ncbi:GFA family protein [Phenylobacterium aquaticum]|uniref:GFA family protein n=1 Tax=Phenylobacterium aquaticum TaxID=1763816 RepID=UPI0026F31717|nr:GFA family protein [Phenylobacterium aquaticum]